MKGKAIRYSADELAWLEANSTLPISAWHAGFVAAFGRIDVAPANLTSLRKRRGWKTGRTGQFEKGITPHNKGKACAPGTGGHHPNAVATQFKPGVLRGRAAVKYKPVGTERVSVDGYRERKINDDYPLQARWRAVHLINWEAVNGPLPKGMALKCQDGNRLNVDPANWMAVPRALLPRLNGGTRKRLIAFDEAAPELRPTILAAAQLDHALRQRRTKDKANG